MPDEEESVLLGAAILAASAAKHYPSVQDAMKNMCGTGQVTLPNQLNTGFVNNLTNYPNPNVCELFSTCGRILTRLKLMIIENIVKKKKLLIMSNSSFCHNLFNSIKNSYFNCIRLLLIC